MSAMGTTRLSAIVRVIGTMVAVGTFGTMVAVVAPPVRAAGGSATIESAQANDDGVLVTWTSYIPSNVDQLQYSFFGGGLPASYIFVGNATPAVSGTFQSPSPCAGLTDCFFKLQITGSEHREDGTEWSWAAVSEWVKVAPSTDPADEKLDQTIALGLLDGESIQLPTGFRRGGYSLTIPAEASSGLPVRLSSLTPAVCATVGLTIVALAPGTCTVLASQSGNQQYNAAPDMIRSVTLLAPTVKSRFAELLRRLFIWASWIRERRDEFHGGGGGIRG